jgi:hypothetical protein
MSRSAKLVLLIPVAIVVVALSIANRQHVTFSIDPFGDPDPALSVSLPLYWLLFAAIAIGVLTGGSAAWLRQRRWRRAARHDHAEIERLRRETGHQPEANAHLTGGNRSAA